MGSVTFAGMTDYGVRHFRRGDGWWGGVKRASGHQRNKARTIAQDAPSLRRSDIVPVFCKGEAHCSSSLYVREAVFLPQINYALTLLGDAQSRAHRMDRYISRKLALAAALT